jgi:hypothetical protein
VDFGDAEGGGFDLITWRDARLSRSTVFPNTTMTDEINRRFVSVTVLVTAGFPGSWSGTGFAVDAVGTPVLRREGRLRGKTARLVRPHGGTKAQGGVSRRSDAGKLHLCSIRKVWGARGTRGGNAGSVLSFERDNFRSWAPEQFWRHWMLFRRLQRRGLGGTCRWVLLCSGRFRSRE